MAETFSTAWTRLSTELQDSSRELFAECEGAPNEIYDHRYEPAMQSDITAPIQRELLKQGLHGAWGKPAAS
ncbi:MAG: hypothetical protein O2968_16900 [Acidobacteria bacterium]|nr:hypothetical protein [Acidobacteriota bacterium]